MSLLTFAERLASIDRSAVQFLPECCLCALDKISPCTACVDTCPVQAISAGSPPIFDAQVCQGCLACLPVCPTGAYSADDAVPDLLTSAARLESTQMELVCSLNPLPQQGVSDQTAGLMVRGCLAGLGAGAGMALAASGFEHIIYRCEACADCPWGSLLSLIESQVVEIQQLLASWGKSDVPVICKTLETSISRPLWKAENPPVSRRDLFRIAAKQAKIAAARAIENGDAALARQPGRDRTRKLKAALALGEPFDLEAALPQSDFAQLFTNDDCTACGACARACPTDAIWLEMDQEKKRFNLVFYAQNCIACGFCVRSCAPNALKMEGIPKFEHVFRTQKPVLLQAGDLVRCQRCNTLIAVQSATHLCPMCQFRQSNPFGSKIQHGFEPHLPEKKSSSI